MASLKSSDNSNFTAEGSVFIGIRHHDVTDQYVIIVDDITVTGTENTSGVLEANLNLNSYPNPASEVLNISLVEPMTSITVVGVDGRTVIISSVTGTTATLDVAALVPGVYYYTVEIEKGNVLRNSFVKK